jgi:lipoyl(octanoyl) transferase
MSLIFDPPEGADDTLLHAYLLGTVDFETVLTLQRALVYQIAGQRRSLALVLCEHPPLITVGRHGSPAHIHYEPEELTVRGWPVRWVNRGGGCVLHLPGQLAIYPIVALDGHGLGLDAYLERLHQLVMAVLDDFGVRANRWPGRSGLWVGDRPIAEVGVAVRRWVAHFGVSLNIHPDLALFRRVQVGGPSCGPMTSLERERRGPLRPALVRERLIEHFAAAFGCARTSLFFGHPLVKQRSAHNGVAAHS